MDRARILLADDHTILLDACERIKMLLRDARIIFLTMSDDADTAGEAIRRGASGYLMKKSPAPELMAGIQTLLKGEAAGILNVSPRTIAFHKHSIMELRLPYCRDLWQHRLYERSVGWNRMRGS
jgi:ActR/RegA family two-component response regulator